MPKCPILTPGNVFLPLIQLKIDHPSFWRPEGHLLRWLIICSVYFCLPKKVISVINGRRIFPDKPSNKNVSVQFPALVDNIFFADIFLHQNLALVSLSLSVSLFLLQRLQLEFDPIHFSQKGFIPTNDVDALEKEGERERERESSNT